MISKGATVLYCYSNHLYLKQYLTLFILSLSSMVSKQQEGKASIMKVMMSKRAKSHMFSTKTSIASWLIGKLWYANNLRRTEVTKKLWNWWLSVHCSQCGCGNHQITKKFCEIELKKLFNLYERAVKLQQINFVLRLLARSRVFVTCMNFLTILQQESGGRRRALDQVGVRADLSGHWGAGWGDQAQ